MPADAKQTAASTDAARPGGEPQAAVEDQSALALIDDAELKGALEAILLVVDEPVTEIVLAQILEQPTERIGAALITVSEGYTAAGHGFDLRKVAGGWRLYTRPEYAPYVERFVLDGQSVRLTQAALETLAVVAYKQPVTRSRISAIRGSTAMASSVPWCPGVWWRNVARSRSRARSCTGRPPCSSKSSA
ncbi:hypothetical protein Phou_006640 [Phytohabitans houttuyneae]|uniref:SMC-Scp complex subunit ScpB n=1 Tax=Phytohabitans houttuyneae TaxID=1076126 RepID=A0A6V8JYX8_9ACTN|nr:hypothetical protein Phou_006640 [Phytohabitans houttuyneae]